MDGCDNNLLKAPTFPSFLTLIGQLATISTDENLWIIRIGSNTLSTHLTKDTIPYRKSPLPIKTDTKITQSTTLSSFMNRNGTVYGNDSNIIHLLEKYSQRRKSYWKYGKNF